MDKEIAAVNGDRLRLSTGDYAREYFVKTRPSDRGWHGKVLFEENRMTQTDLFCVLASEILEE